MPEDEFPPPLEKTVDVILVTKPLVKHVVTSSVEVAVTDSGWPKQVAPQVWLHADGTRDTTALSRSEAVRRHEDYRTGGKR